MTIIPLRIDQGPRTWRCQIGRVWWKYQTNVETLRIVTPLSVSPSRILADAMEAGMSEVVVIGFDRDNEEYFAASEADAGAVLYHLERAKLRLLRVVDEADNKPDSGSA